MQTRCPAKFIVPLQKIRWKEKCDSGWKTAHCYKNLYFYHFMGFILLLKIGSPLLGTQVSEQPLNEMNGEILLMSAYLINLVVKRTFIHNKESCQSLTSNKIQWNPSGY